MWLVKVRFIGMLMLVIIFIGMVIVGMLRWWMVRLLLVI